MTAQPEALRLAEYLETYGPRSNIDCTAVIAAAELRRLHDVNQQMLVALEHAEPWLDGLTVQEEVRAAIAAAEGETK